METRKILMDKKRKNNSLVIIGPTASGKSSLALHYAKKLNGRIINADRIQLYKDLPILTALPTQEDFSTANHKLYGILNYQDNFSVKDWLTAVTAEINNAVDNKILPIIVGGTGMYINALINGLSEIPEIPQNIVNDLSEKSTEDLFEILKEKDKKMALKIDKFNRHRVLRALSVIIHTGKSIEDYWLNKDNNHRIKQDYTILEILPTMRSLKENIINRTKSMIESGAVEEMWNFLENQQNHIDDNRPLMITNAIGYDALKKYVLSVKNNENSISIKSTIDALNNETWQYARRQMTWIRNQVNAHFTIIK